MFLNTIILDCFFSNRDVNPWVEVSVREPMVSDFSTIVLRDTELRNRLGHGKAQKLRFGNDSRRIFWIEVFPLNFFHVSI